MSTSELERTTAGGARAGAVRVGRTDYVVERPSGRKASTALRLIRRVSKTVKTVTRELGEFERNYHREHSLELDRVQARMRYGERVVYDADGELVRHPDGSPLAGQPILRSPLDAMSEEDWQRAGQVLRLPMAPSLPEKIGAVIDTALEDAEDEVYELLALFTISNEDVARAKREQRLEEVLAERADELLDEGGLDELLELAVVIGETVDAQFARKASDLGGRLGNLRRLLGIQTPQEAPTPEEATATAQTATEATQTDNEDEPAPATSSSSSRPTSSPDSPSSSDGTPTPSSTPTTPSSSPSANGSTTDDDAPRPSA